jgi:hypothetical protein
MLETNATAALHTLNDKLNTTIQNANAALESEKFKAEKLESDLREAKTKTRNANTALLIEKIQAESDLNEAKTKYTDAERKAIEAEATHTAALTAIKAMKDQELEQQRVELTTKHEEEVRRIAFLPEAVVVVEVATAYHFDGETVNIFIFFSLVVIK